MVKNLFDMGKKAFMKTIEIMLVIVFTTIFLLALLQNQFSTPVNEKAEYLIELEKDSGFRNYVLQNTGCFNSTTSSSGYIRRYLPSRLDYNLCIGTKPTELPVIDVYVNNMYFSGNLTSVQTKTIILYYWIS